MPDAAGGTPPAGTYRLQVRARLPRGQGGPPLPERRRQVGSRPRCDPSPAARPARRSIAHGGPCPGAGRGVRGAPTPGPRPGSARAPLAPCPRGAASSSLPQTTVLSPLGPVRQAPASGPVARLHGGVLVDGHSDSHDARKYRPSQARCLAALGEGCVVFCHTLLRFVCDQPGVLLDSSISQRVPPVAQER